MASCEDRSPLLGRCLWSYFSVSGQSGTQADKFRKIDCLLGLIYNEFSLQIVFQKVPLIHARAYEAFSLEGTQFFYFEKQPR